jgi:hypothetical protein
MSLVIQTIEAEIVQTQRDIQGFTDQIEIKTKEMKTKPQCIGKGNPMKQCRKAISNDIRSLSTYRARKQATLRGLIEKQQVILSQKKEITIPIVSAITDEPIPLTPVITTFDPIVPSIVSPTVPTTTVIPDIKSKLSLPIILSIGAGVYLLTRKK